MVRVSSDWTLFYKLFLPIVWTVFFGALVIIVMFYIRMPQAFRIGFLLCYVIGMLLLYFTFFRLKRVECTDEHIYVTNYFKTYRYSYDSIGAIRSADFLIFKVIGLLFKGKTAFGRRVFFLRRRKVWDEQVQLHRELNALVK